MKKYTLFGKNIVFDDAAERAYEIKVNYEFVELRISQEFQAWYKEQNTNTVTALYRVSDHSVSSNKLKAMRWQWNILRNEMDLPVYKAVYYFIHYAIRAFAKAMR